MQNVERAKLLIEQHRYKEAEKELLIHLSIDPNDPETLYLLSFLKSEDKKFEEAETFIKTAIGINPYNPYLIYQYAIILSRQDKYQEAEKHVREAIQKNPQEADFFALLSSIYLNQKDWQKALEYADKGLELSPDNLSCLNLRSTALIKLDKKEDSYKTIEHALNYDPNNSSTHANLGWGLLEKGDHKKALEHFRKALELNPRSEYAKMGMVEALKARYFVYRMFLKYSFWISNMKSSMQWGVLLGFYFGSRLLRFVSDKVPALKPFLMPLVIVYVLFAISTWIIRPISNLFLRFNVYGKYALTKDEIATSNFVGSALVVGVVGLLGYLISPNELFIAIAIFGFSMMIPFSSMYVVQSGRNRKILIAYAFSMLSIGTLGIVSLLVGKVGLYELLSAIYILGIIAYQFISNALIL
jgi:tetratricopeptide (TPR) repeat protein